MKKHILIISLLLLVLATTVATADNQIVLKFASTQPADFEMSPTYSAIYRFKDYVESATNGKVRIDLYMGGVMGDEKQNFVNVQNGTLQLAHAGDGPIPEFFAPMQVLSIPYLFINEPIAWDVLDGRFGKKFDRAFVKQTGVRILAWAENGYRCFTNDVRLIQRPSDMTGLSIRTMQNPAHMAMVTALGATPTPIPWLQLYDALKNKTVNGQENPLSLIIQAKFYEVQKYLTLDEHIYGPHFLWVNEQCFQDLPKDVRQAILDGAKIYQTVHRGQQQAIQARTLQTLKANGMIIYKPTDAEKAEFRNVSQPAVLNYLKTQVDKYWIDLLLDEVKRAEKDREKELFQSSKWGGNCEQ